LIRLAALILAMTGIGVALVHVRGSQAATRCEIQRLRLRGVDVSRRIWDQQARLGRMTGPQGIRFRADRMALNLTEPGRRASLVSRVARADQ